MKYLFLFIFLQLLLVNCSTVHKTFSKEKVNSDSVSVVKTVQSKLSKFDSTSKKVVTADYNKETIYQYDTIYQQVQGKTVLKYVPRKVIVYENGKFTKEKDVQKKTYDSTTQKSFDSTKVATSSLKIQEDKKTSRLSFWAIVCGILLIIGFVLIYCSFRIHHE